MALHGCNSLAMFAHRTGKPGAQMREKVLRNQEHVDSPSSLHSVGLRR